MKPLTQGGTVAATADAAPPTRPEERVLIDVARDSVRHGLRTGRAMPVDVAAFSTALRATAASFVTLTLRGALRGCIGKLAATQPLVADVAENAYSAAFRDPRFPPLDAAEFLALRFAVSVLTAPEPFPVRDERDLLARLEPRVHGVILSDGPHRATFLPKVWEDLPDPRRFLAHLRMKAGLPVDYWSDDLRFEVYRCHEVTDGDDA